MLVLQNLHLGRIWQITLGRILAWTFLVKRLWSCAATLNLSVSALIPALLRYWWVSCMSTSTFWLRSGCWSCKGFDFQAVSPFSHFSWAILLNFQAFFVSFISTSNLISRSRSILRAKSVASFTTECKPFFFYTFRLVVTSSDRIISRLIVDFLCDSLSWVKPLAPLLLER